MDQGLVFLGAAGEVAEWLKAAPAKELQEATSVEGSNPSLSVQTNQRVSDEGSMR